MPACEVVAPCRRRCRSGHSPADVAVLPTSCDRRSAVLLQPDVFLDVDPLVRDRARDHVVLVGPQVAAPSTKPRQPWQSPANEKPLTPVQPSAWIAFASATIAANDAGGVRSGAAFWNSVLLYQSTDRSARYGARVLLALVNCRAQVARAQILVLGSALMYCVSGQQRVLAGELGHVDVVEPDEIGRVCRHGSPWPGSRCPCSARSGRCSTFRPGWVALNSWTSAIAAAVGGGTLVERDRPLRVHAEAGVPDDDASEDAALRAAKPTTATTSEGSAAPLTVLHLSSVTLSRLVPRHLSPPLSAARALRCLSKRFAKRFDRRT